MKKVLLISALVATMTVVACSKKDDDSKGSDAATGNEISQGLSKVVSGMDSSMANGDALAGATREARDFDVDATCKNSGYAYASGDTGAPAGAPAQGTAAYAARNAMCNLRKSPDGPDTVRGAMDRVQAFLCAVGDLTYDGVERNITITINATCFSQAFIDMATQEGITSATLPVTAYDNPGDMTVAGNAAYDKGVKIDLSEVGQGMYYIQFNTSSTLFSSQMLAIKDGTEDWWASVTFDYTTAASSVLRLEGRFNGNNDDPNGRRYVRALVEGATSGGEFTNPSNVEFILFDVSASGGSTTDPDYINYQTLKGNSTDGYFIWTGSASETDDADKSTIFGTTFQSGGDDMCVGDGSCTGNTGLVVDGAAKTAFVKGSYSGQTGYQTLTSLFGSKGEFTFTELSFDAHLN